MDYFLSTIGVCFSIVVAWLLSERKNHFPWRIVIAGVILQILVAFIVLKFPPGAQFFAFIGEAFTNFLAFSTRGSLFLFGNIVKPEFRQTFGFIFAFNILPTIIFFSSVIGILYHWNIMQKIIQFFGKIMQKSLKTTGVESMSVAANIFFGPTESALIIRPYLSRMTKSELFAIMVGGFVNIAGGVLGGYIQMGISATALIAASVMTAPAGLLLAKIIIPPQTSNDDSAVELYTAKTVNTLEAAVNGATEGLKLAVNVGTMLLAFVSLMAVLDAIIGGISGFITSNSLLPWFPSSLREGLGIVFQPLAYLIGIPAQESYTFGKLMGTRVAVNDIIAYSDLAQLIKNQSISARTQFITTVAMCGFGNFGTIAIEIGGIGAMAPERKSEIASLALRAMLAGILGNIMTASIVSLLL